MGGYVSRNANNSVSAPEHDEAVEGRGRKRTRDEEDTDSETEQLMRTPQRKKLKCTSRYIYQTLFVNGESSDVTIRALGKEWHLHKIYLCQSSYFASMFSGSWKESSESEIGIDVPDDNIDIKALEVALGSLYRDDVLIEPAKVVSILAAASLLQLDGLIQQCADIMTDTISPKTVCSYHAAATAYGLQGVACSCLEWLESNLMDVQRASLLRELSLELFETVVKSPNLFVLQVEMDVYSMVKKFVFLHITPSWTGEYKQIGKDADAYFRKLKSGEFLESDRGKNFLNLFQSLRLNHVINDQSAVRHLERDKIVPTEWLLPVYKHQWQCMLSLEQGQDQGPTTETVTPEQFFQHSMRCGRVMTRDTEYCWRWTGYNYGVDLLVSFANRLLIFRRNTVTHPVTASVSLQAQRNIMFRVRVVSYDTQGHVLYQKSSDITSLSLGRDEEIVVLNIDRHAPFPMRVSVNLLCMSPREESNQPPVPEPEAEPDNIEDRPGPS
ncbi:germ cell-less protein-like 1 [Amphiura filiformis]|uniref:germ cell-less protein-like 1 n=1 Tax=Amphiura filiformis TaxID=82378 RepID=UPI003B2180D4